MRAIFYSADGVIWYWGRYTTDEIAQLKLAGWRVTADTKRFRGSLT